MLPSLIFVSTFIKVGETKKIDLLISNHGGIGTDWLDGSERTLLGNEPFG